MSTNEEIIEGFRNGDSKIIGECYKNIRPLIQTHILKNNGSNEDVDNIIQESITKFWERCMAKEFVIVGNYVAYIFGIARYTWLDELRKRKIQGLHIPIENREEEKIDTEERSKYQELVELVIEEINKLSLSCQEIFNLVIFKSLSYKETAKKLKTKEGAIRQRLSVCKKRLKESISQNRLFLDFSDDDIINKILKDLRR